MACGSEHVILLCLDPFKPKPRGGELDVARIEPTTLRCQAPQATTSSISPWSQFWSRFPKSFYFYFSSDFIFVLNIHRSIITNCFRFLLRNSNNCFSNHSLSPSLSRTHTHTHPHTHTPTHTHIHNMLTYTHSVISLTKCACECKCTYVWDSLSYALQILALVFRVISTCLLVSWSLSLPLSLSHIHTHTRTHILTHLDEYFCFK